jgi:hypothetical protein
MLTTSSIVLPHEEQIKTLFLESGWVYTQTATWYWSQRQYGRFNSDDLLDRFDRGILNKGNVRSAITNFENALRSWHEESAIGINSRAPVSKKRYGEVKYLQKYVEIKNGKLVLLNGHKSSPLILFTDKPINLSVVEYIQLRWQDGKYKALVRTKL